jgi:hypothetical protein
MERLLLNCLLLLVTFAFLLSACTSRRRDTATTTSGASTVTPVVTTTTSPLPAASPTSNQPSTQPSAASAAASATASAATKSGWWIRINSGATTAQAITFQIGANKLDREEWRVWRAGEPAEFDVPEKYLQAPRLYVRGNVSPIGKFGVLCVMYKARGVDHMSFDDDDSGTHSQTEVDIKCR